MKLGLKRMYRGMAVVFAAVIAVSPNISTEKKSIETFADGAVVVKTPLITQKIKRDEEIDALITLGIDPGEYLLLPKFFAMILVLPCLTIISDICGIAGGMAVVCSMLQVSISEYISKCLEVIHVIDLTQGLVKSCFFGFIVSSVGCMKGIYAERDTHGVGKSTTSAVVSAIFLIVVTDAVLTAVFGIISQS